MQLKTGSTYYCEHLINLPCVALTQTAVHAHHWRKLSIITLYCRKCGACMGSVPSRCLSSRYRIYSYSVCIWNEKAYLACKEANSQLLQASLFCCQKPDWGDTSIHIVPTPLVFRSVLIRSISYKSHIKFCDLVPACSNSKASLGWTSRTLDKRTNPLRLENSHLALPPHLQ